MLVLIYKNNLDHLLTLIIYNRFICFVSFLPVEPIVLLLAVVERGEPLGFLNILIHYLMSTVSFFRFVYNSLTQRRFHFSCLKVRSNFSFS